MKIGNFSSENGCSHRKSYVLPFLPKNPCRSRKPSVAHLDGQGQDCPSSKISHSMCSGARARSTECAWCRGFKKKGAHRKTLLTSSMLKEKNAKSCIKFACESKILLFSSVRCVHENHPVFEQTFFMANRGTICMYSLLRTTIPRRRACLPHVDTTHLPFCCETSLMRKPGRTHPLGTVPTVAGKGVDHSLLA